MLRINDPQKGDHMDIGASNAFYLYMGKNEKAAVMQYRYVLDQTVDVGILREAADKAVERMPVFGVQPFLDGSGRLNARKNDRDVPVFTGDEKYLHLGTDETNGYLFCIWVKDSGISVCASHALSDGRGIFFFSQLLIYEYLLLSGCDMKDTSVLFSDDNKGKGDVTASLADICAQIEAEPDPDIYVPKNVFALPENCVHEGTAYTRDLLLSWDQERLMKVVHELHTTPVCFMAALTAEAIKTVYDTGERTIVASVPVDMRAMLETDSQSNFTSNISLPYDESYDGMSMEEKTSALRASLKSQAVKGNLVTGIKSFAPVVSMIAAQPLDDPEALEKLFGNGQAPVTRTYLLSNIGAVSFPEKMDAHIRDFSLRGTNLESAPAYVLLSYRDKGMLIIQQNYDDMRIPQKIQESLKGYNVDSELSDNELTRCHMVDPAKFERI